LWAEPSSTSSRIDDNRRLGSNPGTEGDRAVRKAPRRGETPGPTRLPVGTAGWIPGSLPMESGSSFRRARDFGLGVAFMTLMMDPVLNGRRSDEDRRKDSLLSGLIGVCGDFGSGNGRSGRYRDGSIRHLRFEFSANRTAPGRQSRVPVSSLLPHHPVMSGTDDLGLPSRLRGDRTGHYSTGQNQRKFPGSAGETPTVPDFPGRCGEESLTAPLFCRNIVKACRRMPLHAPFAWGEPLSFARPPGPLRIAFKFERFAVGVWL